MSAENSMLFFTLGAISTAALIASWTMLTKNNKDILYRFDIDHRFTDSVRYNNLVFMSGQVGEGSTIEEQTRSALDNVDLALGTCN